MTLHDWILAHPFLEGVARLRARIEKAAKTTAIPSLCFPDWDDYRRDFAAGVPLLASAPAAPDLASVAPAISFVLDEVRGAEHAQANAGLEHYVRWVVLSMALQPIVRAFGEWRDDERWMRAHCPT